MSENIRWDVYLIFSAIEENNIENGKLLMGYVNTHNIKLNINIKSGWYKYPLQSAIKNNNIEMVKFLKDNVKKKKKIKVYSKGYK